MSADNYSLIQKRRGKYVLLIGCASNDWVKEKGEFDELEEAIKAAPPTEYGLSFELEETNL